MRQPLTRFFEQNFGSSPLISISLLYQIEREVQFVCSYLPGSIGDKCEELVDKFFLSFWNSVDK